MISRILGILLSGIHAGQTHLAWNHPAVARAPDSLRLTSDSFAAGGLIPRHFAGKGVGDNVSPALSWSDPPPGTQELVLVMEDPDAPLPRPFVHLIAYGISSDTRTLPEAALAPSNQTLRFGRNTFAGTGYTGPRALPAHGPHRYVFQLFALKNRLSFDQPPSLKALLTAMEGSVIARGRIDGTFEQK